MNCKGCDAPDCEVISEEIVAIHNCTYWISDVPRYECPVCGPHTICDTCGTWDTEACPAWCQEIKDGREYMEEL